MSLEVACLGQPFVDLHFEGVAELPAPGEERTGTGLAITPGGSATVTLGCARLGLRTALVAGRPTDPAGILLQRLVAAEGIDWRGPEVERAAVTVTVPTGGDRSMITFDPGTVCAVADAFALDPAIVIADLPQLREVPAGPVIAVLGDEDAAALARGGWRSHAARCSTLIANEREALALTGLADPEAAASELASVAPAAAITLADRGAIAVIDGRAHRSPAPEVVARDATGAGDLFVAAYAWGELRGLDPRSRLALACAYASLSLGAGLASASALTESAFLEQLAALEVDVPDQLQGQRDNTDQEEVLR